MAMVAQTQSFDFAQKFLVDERGIPYRKAAKYGECSLLCVNEKAYRYPITKHPCPNPLPYQLHLNASVVDLLFFVCSHCHVVLRCVAPAMMLTIMTGMVPCFGFMVDYLGRGYVHRHSGSPLAAKALFHNRASTCNEYDSTKSQNVRRVARHACPRFCSFGRHAMWLSQVSLL